MRQSISAIVGATTFLLAVFGWLAASTVTPKAAGAMAVGACAAYGYAYDFKTVKQAHAAAIQKCKGACKAVVTTQKGCAALAVDAHKKCGPQGYANGAKLGLAQNVALKSCYQNGGRDCMIRAWICDAKG
jgi:hypothetical protein